MYKNEYREPRTIRVRAIGTALSCRSSGSALFWGLKVPPSSFEFLGRRTLAGVAGRGILGLMAHVLLRRMHFSWPAAKAGLRSSLRRRHRGIPDRRRKRERR